MYAKISPFIIIIPAKNEVKTIGKIIVEIKSHFNAPIVVIDDASTDNTIQVAESAGAIVLPLVFSLGAWGATQTGLRYASKHRFKTAITMDADGQHEVASIPILLNAMQEEQYDMIIGSFPKRGSISRKFAWCIFRKLSGLKLQDLTSGLRIYNQAAIDLLASQKASLLDYQDMGVLILLNRMGMRIAEQPIFMHPRKEGHSRIFSSWWAVSRYMLFTIILCIARLNIKRFYPKKQ
ncbi:MAG: glycosyltransferase family 2 protein [Thiomargarita sp.]|nr:glycosyltransferase family 2 protein [Thiomargarita sp.]